MSKWAEWGWLFHYGQSHKWKAVFDSELKDHVCLIGVQLIYLSSFYNEHTIFNVEYFIDWLLKNTPSIL
jgi:hypothetical protein